MDKDLQDAFKRAAAIASVVPEPMQEAAFLRALDSIQGGQPETGRSAEKTPKARATRATPDAPTADPVVALMDLDRSKMGEVDAAHGGLGKGLALLLAAKRELQIDGLGANVIAEVLTDKFRWRITRQAVTEAMDKAGNRVDRRKAGRSIRYRIMDAGERWLATPRAESSKAVRPSGGRRPRRATKATEASDTRGADAQTPTTRSKVVPQRPAGATGGSRRPSEGPKGAVEKLIESGWFRSPRGLSAIRQELESSFALRFKPTDLSPTMTRLLRDKRLKRVKNDAGQYEYSA